MKTGKWCYLLPVIGTAFGLWYVQSAFVDVVYSDYIRLVNSYLPDVWNPDKFFVGDILTRIPLNYAARIINVTFFDIQINFALMEIFWKEDVKKTDILCCLF